MVRGEGVMVAIMTPGRVRGEHLWRDTLTGLIDRHRYIDTYTHIDRHAHRVYWIIQSNTECN